MTTNPTQKRKPKKIPVYLDRLPPCNNACPAGNNIQAWLQCLAKNKLFEAWESVMRTNPIPATIGRVCYHPCEDACNRKCFDSSVSIHCMERYLGDLALQEGWKVRLPEKKTGKKVLVVGAGPAGLSSAYQLCRMGHEVTIFEAASYAGGIMHDGIPSYRLPRQILDKEIARIADMGVKIELNHKVTDLVAEKQNGKFDAVFISIGAHKDKTTELPGSTNTEVIGAIEFLKAVELKKITKINGSIIAYGGGNTAIDVVRVAKRLGATNSTIVYRRDREQMPAFQSEVIEAEEEGIQLKTLRTIKEIHADKITLEIMELNSEKKPQSTGKFEDIPNATIVLALGQDPESDFLKNIPEITRQKDGSITVDAKLATGAAGIFAGGDVITTDRSVTISIGHGRKAAYGIDAYLRSETFTKSEKHELAAFEFLHLDNAVKSPAFSAKLLDPAIRSKDFAEVVDGADPSQSLTEAKRCFSCGNCFECDGCYQICPVKAITKLGAGKRYKIDYDVCIGCGKCFRRCPCGAIKMVDNPEA
ncbi:MAG: NAD(P)-binding protein [Gammaproteobacteria bacterium]